MKITPIKEGTPLEASKHVIVKETDKGYIPQDPNNNGYYQIAHVGKVSLIQVLEAPSSPARKTEYTDKDILNMGAPQQATCVLRTVRGSIAYAIHEVLTSDQRAKAMIEKYATPKS